MKEGAEEDKVVTILTADAAWLAELVYWYLNMHFSAGSVILLLGALDFASSVIIRPSPFFPVSEQPIIMEPTAVCPVVQAPAECPAEVANECLPGLHFGLCGKRQICCSDGCSYQCTDIVAPTKRPDKVCPDWPIRLSQCSQRAKMNITCRENSDCPGKKWCCQDACKNHCVDPAPVMETKACPSTRPAEECPDIEDRNICNSDKDCDKNRKCCYNGCGFSCIAPETVIVARGEKPVIAGTRVVSRNKLTGGNIRFTCRAQGVSSLRISWYKDWEPLDNQVTRKSRDGRKLISQLNIPNVRCKDSGMYHCVVKTKLRHAVKTFDLKTFNRVYAQVCYY